MRVSRRQLRQENGELIASQAGNDVGRAKIQENGFGHRNEHLVTLEMAIPIVHLLKIVDIQVSDGERR